MEQRNLSKMLKEYGRRSKAVQGKHREENILKIMEIQQGQQRFASFPVFAGRQIGMLGKFSLLWYFLWFILFVLGLKGDGIHALGEHGNEILLSAMPSFLLLLTIQDFSGIFSDSMLELEKTTKFTPEHVVMVHFISMSVMHALLPMAGILLVKDNMVSGLMELLLYGYTPLTLTTAVFLIMTRYLRGEHLKMAGVAVVAGVIFFLVVMGGDVPVPLKTADIYSPDMLAVWKAAFTAGTIVCVLEIFRMGRKELKFYGT